MLYMDPLYLIFALPALLLALYAQWRVQSAYRRYLREANTSGMTGVQAAQHLLRAANLQVSLEGVGGQLTDHYDPRKKILRLSSGVANSASVASVAIVAHEVGHALQDAQAYALLQLRSGLVPVVNFASWLGPILFMLGLFFNAEPLQTLGLLAFGAAVVFALVTLPVELDASRRALKLLEQSRIVSSGAEIKGVKSVLNAAALTYIAALAQAVSTMLYYLMLSGRRRRR